MGRKEISMKILTNVLESDEKNGVLKYFVIRKFPLDERDCLPYGSQASCVIWFRV